MTASARGRRRTRARRVRVARDISRALAGLLALLALGGLAAALAGPFPIRHVSVLGTVRLDPAAVRAASGLAGANVFGASARHAEAALGAALPAVRRSRVTILLPDRAVIDVEERLPALVVASSAGRVFADEEGVLFSAGGASDGLAVLEDETARRASGERLDAVLVRAAREIGAREPGYFGRPVRAIKLTRAFGFVAVLEGGTEIRLGGPEQIDLKLETARQIVLSRAVKRLDYVDVRTRENPVFFPRD